MLDRSRSISRTPHQTHACQQQHRQDREGRADAEAHRPIFEDRSLVPRTDQSDETDPNLGITPRKNRYLSALAIEAAWVAVRHDPQLLARFTKLTRRMKRQDAIVRIARNVLSRVRYVWRTRNPCKPL